MHREVIGKTVPGLPFSPAVRVGDFLFVAGQVGTDPQTGMVAGPEIAIQTSQALQNLAEILKEAGSDLTKVDNVTVYLTRADDFFEMNRIYSQFFPEKPPARTTVVVAALVRPELVIEISAIAHL